MHESFESRITKKLKRIVPEIVKDTLVQKIKKVFKTCLNCINSKTKILKREYIRNKQIEHPCWEKNIKTVFESKSYSYDLIV